VKQRCEIGNTELRATRHTRLCAVTSGLCHCEWRFFNV
jgi:hypothetical protein